MANFMKQKEQKAYTIIAKNTKEQNKKTFDFEGYPTMLMRHIFHKI